MSTGYAMEFGSKFGNNYGEVVEKWSKKLDGVKKVTPELFSEWGADLHEALSESIVKALVEETVKDIKKTGAPIPSDELINMYAKIAAKGALAADTMDLLERLRRSANAPITLTASSKTTNTMVHFYMYEEGQNELHTLTAAVMSPSELVKRAAQTVAQVFDMSQDRFRRTMNNFANRGRRTLAKRIWHTNSGPTSRHARLDGQTKAESDSFIWKGQKIYGPRPPGGAPEDWSNCSCTLEYVR